LHVDPELWEKGWRLFYKRDDKNWSFTDCVSFVVMNERSIKNALISDKHFIQAGFSAMLQN
jgi:predicted nucleic acid-binding protein